MPVPRSQMTVGGRDRGQKRRRHKAKSRSLTPFAEGATGFGMTIGERQSRAQFKEAQNEVCATGIPEGRQGPANLSVARVWGLRENWVSRRGWKVPGTETPQAVRSWTAGISGKAKKDKIL